MNYKIITDNCCDLPEEMYDGLQLEVVRLSVLYKGENCSRYTEQWLKDMFDGLRKGETATTAAVNPQAWKDGIRPVLEMGLDALVLTFSSGLSATHQSAVIAAEELAEEYPQRKIRVVDTLCASLGQGLLVWHACRKRDEGMSLEDLTAWCEEARFRLCHWFTVDDLMYLKRGGRISAATALVGTMLRIKPVLHVDNEGHLISKAKVRGRKASIEAIADKMAQLALPDENDTVFICHGDCIEDANGLADTVKRRFGVKNVLIHYVGAVIGSHSGPGTLALFFMGHQR